VQTLAIDEMTRVGSRSGFQQLGGGTTAIELQALVELAGIWSEAGQHREVLQLVNGSTRWGTGDVGKLLGIQDSVDVPFGVMLGRALEAAGERAAAIRVARATISQLPARDAAYDLLTRLDSNSPATLDELFAHDPFEERPLIWKATVLAQRGALDEAETTVRRAISIDPSDGEEGVNDRMRAYAVLADLLKRKGDSSGATTYEQAVRAIRMSEHADQLHEAGLFERAFAEYRGALEQFSDAYCIQSRLAVQLSRRGRRAEALEHYRRAYELMPDSFGRVESHCFGCESVFQGDEAQSLAGRVFEEAIRKSPGKAQAYYLLAYLREQQNRPAEALEPLRRAVGIDPLYLNAWKHLDKAAERTYVEPWEVDLARLKLLELDPLSRHVTYSLDQVGDLQALWHSVEQAGAKAAAMRPIRDHVHELRASAAAIRKARDALPPEMREQLGYFDAMSELSESLQLPKSPARTLAEHKLVVGARALIGGEPGPMY
jgi:tetratricopeptide (TPR) repeat protein